MIPLHVAVYAGVFVIFDSFALQSYQNGPVGSPAHVLKIEAPACKSGQMRVKKVITMRIRPEQCDDYEKIYLLIKEAFATAEHADGNEQDLVVALRKSDAYVSQLALVAEIKGELVGHILFTKSNVGNQEVLVLAPLSVKPFYQKQGIGSSLVTEGHRIAKALNYQYSLVLGSELYYPRFGYAPAEPMGVVLPKGIPSANLMAIPLQENAPPLNGPIAYAKEFGL